MAPDAAQQNWVYGNDMEDNCNAWGRYSYYRSCN